MVLARCGIGGLNGLKFDRMVVAGSREACTQFSTDGSLLAIATPGEGLKVYNTNTYETG